eukprot:368770_1
MLDGIKLNLDNPPLHDGKGIWINNITTYEIVWYDTHQRWTFYDIINNELYLAPINLSPLSDPIILSQPSQAFKWTYIGSRFRWYELEIQCITTPAPTPVLPPTFNFEPCWFPDDIVHDWHLDHLKTWDICYNTEYSDGTTNSDLDYCLNEITSKYGTKPIDLQNVYIFVGAIDKNKSTHAYIGAYGHVQILQTLTDSYTQAQQITYKNKYPTQTWWYYVDHQAFGFSDIERIDLTNGGCDISDARNNNKLCWHLINSRTGGWRAGTKINLNFNRDIFKILYYKQCKTGDICELPAEIGLCTDVLDRWFYNAKSQKCEEFSYGGCGGNGNNFETQAECLSQCQGKGKDAKAMANDEHTHDKFELENAKPTKTHGILSIIIIFSIVILVVLVWGVYQNILKRRVIEIVKGLSQTQTEIETPSVNKNETDRIDSAGIEKETEMI